MSDSTTTTPARPAPPGLTSNLINPVSTGYYQTYCNIICCIFVTLFVSLRIYTRAKLVKCVSWDDYLVILASLVFFADVGLFQYIVKVGLGKHLWDVALSDFSPLFLKIWTFAAMIYSICMFLIKTSILMLYRRLFPIDNFRLLWWVCVVCTVGYSFGAVFSSLFACVPVRANWDLGVKATRCIDKKAFYIGNGVMNIVTDLMILALPIPIVWRLRLELRQKITLSVVFTLGSISCVISLVRLLSIITWIRVGDGDITYTLQNIVSWSEIELAISIVCANAPCLRPFFTTHLPFLSLSFHTRSSSTTHTKHPTTIGGKRSRALSPYPPRADDDADADTAAIFDGTQDVELENYDVEVGFVGQGERKLGYAKHGYKQSTGNVTIVSVAKGRKSGSARASFEEEGEGQMARQVSLRSIGEERGRGKGGDEGGIVVQTTYHVQTIRESV